MNKAREKEIRQQIDAYIKGQLTEEEVQELWNVFAQNPELLEVLELEVNLKAVIEEQALKNTQKTGIIKKLPSWTWHAAAAATILIVALVQFFNVDAPKGIDDYVVQQISPGQIETADGVRAAKDMRITEADSLLNLGFEAAISGNQNRALELFDVVINNFDEEPYGSKAFLNKGILFYNEGNYKIAINAFEEAVDRVEDSRMITEKAYWYLGNALINIDKLEEAREAIYRAYQTDGVFRKPAFRLIQKLNDDLGSTDYEEFDTKTLN